jgi:amidase
MLLNFVYPMTFAEYRRYDGLGLADLIRRGETTAAKLLDLAIRRNEEVNPKLNAVVTKMYDEGMKMLNEYPKDAPFAGVPFLIKDLDIHVAGAAMMSGSRAYKQYITPNDGELARRLRAAGLVFMGKTNTPEFGLTPYTEPVATGIARNPWNTAYSTGGSSGGSAAAVAAGIVPLATASDGGGSIRIPASCCGLFGLKPTRGRVPLGGLRVEGWAGAVVEHCVTRSVRDSAALLDLLHGAHNGYGHLPPPKTTFLEAVNAQAMPKLKIGYTLQHPLGIALDRECINAVMHAASLLRNLGHTVEEIALPYEKRDIIDNFTPVVFGETANTLREMSNYLGREATVGDVELNTWLIGRLGHSFTAQQYAAARAGWNGLGEKMVQLHQTYDLWLSPTLGARPIKIGALQNSAAENAALRAVKQLGLTGLAAKTNLIEKIAIKLLEYIPYTTVANMTGQPSATVPLYWTDKENLPIGIMFTAPMCQEETLFRIAAQLERTQPWFDKVPM